MAPLIELETIVIRVGLGAGNQEFCFGHVKIENSLDKDIKMSSKQWDFLAWTSMERAQLEE